MKHPPTLMIYGTMSANGMAGIYFLKPGTTINDVNYAQLLKDKLPTHMAIHQSLIFMHDGAPCHQLKIVKQFFIKKSHQDQNLWSKMKDLVSQKQPGSSSELVKVIKEVWVKEISGEYC